jgi:hypothetical protein
MKHRLVTTVGLAGVLTVAAVSPALAAQSNVYAVKAKVTSAKGTKAKPAKATVKFGYTVGEKTGLQPAAVKRYTIGFAGMRSNGAKFAKGALVGQGTIDNFVYLSTDPSGKSAGFPCAKQLKIYNAGANKATISISGDAAKCGGVGTLPDIPAKFVPFKGGGTALQFDVPNNILHPIAGLTVAVRSVQSTLKNGFLTSVGYKGAKRPVAVTFLTEDGQTSTVKTTA